MVGVNGEMLILESMMPLQFFESNMHIIVMKRMTDMLETMTEIVNYDREKGENYGNENRFD